MERENEYNGLASGKVTGEEENVQVVGRKMVRACSGAVALARGRRPLLADHTMICRLIVIRHGVVLLT